MNHETQTSRTHELTRKQKLTRRFLPLALLAGGASVLALEASNGDEDAHHTHREGYAEATVNTHVSSEFNDGEDWGHGTAEDLIRRALGKGIPEAYANIHPVASKTPGEIAEMIEDLPVYDQANEALELAGYSDILPGKGDILSIDIAVTADNDDHLSYEVVDAEITDVENNR